MSADEPTRGPPRRPSCSALLVAAARALRARARDAAAPPPPRRPSPTSRSVASATVPANRRAETLVAVLLLLAAACSASASPRSTSCSAGNTQLLGLALGGALALLAAAAIVAGKFVVPQETAVEERGPLLDEERDRGGRRDDRGGRRGDLAPGAAGRRRRRWPGAALVTAAATPLASLGPDAERHPRDAVARGACGWSTTRAGRTAADDDPDRQRSTPRCPSAAIPSSSAPGCSWSGCPPSSLHLPAGAARLGARGDPRLLQDLPARRLRDLALPLSDLPADQRRRRPSPARATTRRSCPARAGGWSSARPGGRCRSCR